MIHDKMRDSAEQVSLELPQWARRVLDSAVETRGARTGGRAPTGTRQIYVQSSRPPWEEGAFFHSHVTRDKLCPSKGRDRAAQVARAQCLCPNLIYAALKLGEMPHAVAVVGGLPKSPQEGGPCCPGLPGLGLGPSLLHLAESWNL
uniref:Uncharacterized protein n=1 Tax=Molossus molossus TaxID=27622 RepID=A0A7J8DPU3_MOLMO|nr:hypothetical protein HJG59_009221 [Molossus molossus]